MIGDGLYRSYKHIQVLDQTTVHKTLREDLHMHKIAAKWVPHALTEQQKWCCRVHLERYQNGENLLNNIIAIDETWVRAYEPELKPQSAEWRHEGSLRKQKFRQNPSPLKLMVILAYDVQEVILCHFLPHDETVNAQYYAAYLQNHLHHAVRCKRPQLQNVIILHDNATPHKVIYVRDLLQCWRWVVLEHPPYSLDLSPCDYDLIPKLKVPLRGDRFRTRDDISIAVRRLIMTNFSHGEADGIRRLPHRWQRTIDSLGDYFEGL